MFSYLEYLIYRLTMMVSLCLPLRVVYWVAFRVADLHYLFDRRGRRAVKDNLRQILGPNADEKMIGYEARWTFRNFGKYLAEFFRFARFGSYFVEKLVLVRGLENMDEAVDKGKGVIVLTGHLGNWELGALALVTKGYGVTAVVLEHKNPRVEALLGRHRTLRGFEGVPAHGFLRGCYRALRSGRSVALLGDRDVTGGGIEMEFFGRTVTLPQGPARLSVRTGAAIVPVFMLRRPNDSWHLYFEKPIYPDTSGNRDEAVKDVMERYVPVLENFIRWHPSQWEIFYNFWKEKGS